MESRDASESRAIPRGGTVLAYSPDGRRLALRQDDVDVVIEVVSQVRYAEIEQKLRALKFDHDMRQGAPRCRWVLGSVTVDIMPTDARRLGHPEIRARRISFVSFASGSRSSYLM